MTNLTKHALADALKELLNTRTLDQLTIQDVADAASVSRKTFYYHFHDIYDLVEWMMVEEWKANIQQGDDPKQWLRNVASTISYTMENRKWVLNIYQSMQHDQLASILSKVTQPQVERSFDTIVAGRPVDAGDRRFVLDIFTYGITALIMSWIGDGMRGDAEFLQDRLMRLFNNSLELLAERCVSDKENDIII
jgi:AcrR family transcriptional regulator